MTKSAFVALALACGLTQACTQAIARGITRAQIDLWTLSIPAYRAFHHY